MLFLDATLTPNRSLNHRTMNIIIACVFGISLLASISFYQMGAIPVVGFFGLDALAFWWALRWNMRRQSQATHIKIDNETIRLHHIDGRGREKHAELPTAFTRVGYDRQSKYQSHLSLAYGHRILIIGHFLTDEEKQGFADVLRQSLARARGHRT